MRSDLRSVKRGEGAPEVEPRAEVDKTVPPAAKVAAAAQVAVAAAAVDVETNTGIKLVERRIEQNQFDGMLKKQEAKVRDDAVQKSIS